ncbi:MAG: NUDIX domain-containing protein [Chloroflexota bacterium]|nr:NUDIX domain-containing protein [Chloroflexota bacterium]
MTKDQTANVKGVQRAVERYGEPVKRSYTLPISEAGVAYWRRVLTRRQSEVVFLIRRSNGFYVTHTKAFYPEGVYRLPSGGIKPGEDILTALWREATEETNLTLHIEDFMAIIHYRFVRGQEKLPFTSYLFRLQERGSHVLRSTDPEEEITGFKKSTLSEVGALAGELESLSGEWRDWGRFRAVAHRVVAELLTQEE